MSSGFVCRGPSAAVSLAAERTEETSTPPSAPKDAALGRPWNPGVASTGYRCKGIVASAGSYIGGDIRGRSSGGLRGRVLAGVAEGALDQMHPCGPFLDFDGINGVGVLQDTAGEDQPLPLLELCRRIRKRTASV